MKSIIFAIGIFCISSAYAAPVLSAAQENAVATAVVTGEINAFTICQATLIRVAAGQTFSALFSTFPLHSVTYCRPRKGLDGSSSVLWSHPQQSDCQSVLGDDGQWWSLLVRSLSNNITNALRNNLEMKAFERIFSEAFSSPPLKCVYVWVSNEGNREAAHKKTRWYCAKSSWHIADYMPQFRQF